jgi:hypothetical protein
MLPAFEAKKRDAARETGLPPEILLRDHASGQKTGVLRDLLERLKAIQSVVDRSGVDFDSLHICVHRAKTACHLHGID